MVSDSAKEPSSHQRAAESDALLRLLEAELPGAGTVTVEPMTGGMSNQLLKVRRGSDLWVLRRPPAVRSTPGAHDVLREARILRALAGTPIPHPTPVLVCDDESVVGVPFYVMPHLDGVLLRRDLPSQFAAADARTAIAFDLVDVLAELHRIDWRAHALTGIGKPEGFTERQVERWMSQLDRYRVRDLPDLDEVADWLRANTPSTGSPTALIHGDYGLHNVLFHPQPPPRLQAVLDWETATIGDALLDLGHFLASWLQDEEHEKWFGARVELDLSGFPTRDQLADRYAERTGFDLTHLNWYRVLARLRIAVILEGAYARHVRGAGDRDAFAGLRERVPNIVAHARAMIEGTA